MSRYDIIEDKQETECNQAILFARVSSKKQDDGVSKEAQLTAMTEYCNQKNLKIIKVFSITESSTIGTRPKFREMIEFLQKQKEKTALVVHSVDRLQRSFEESSLINKLAKDGIIEVHFLRENFNLDQDFEQSREMQYDMNVFTSKMYVAALRAHVKKAIKYNLNIGVFPGKAPLGYINYRDENGNSNIIIDKERGEKIQKLFYEYATGEHSAESLWTLVKEMNLTTRPTKKVSSHLISRNKIIDILRNPFYAGTIVVKHKAYPHHYEKLISPELFEQVQKILDIRGKKLEVPHQQIYGKKQFAFRGIIKCGYCGHSMTSEEHIKNGYVYHYLKCAHRKETVCNQKSVLENELFQQLDREVFSKLQMPAAVLEALKKSVKMKLEENAAINASIERKNTLKLKELDERKERLFNIYLEEGITKEEYQEEKAKIEKQRKVIEEFKKNYTCITTEIKDSVEKIVEIMGNFSTIIKTANPSVQNKLLRLLLENCKIDGDHLTYQVRHPFSRFINIQDKTTIPEYISSNLQEFTSIENPVNNFVNSVPIITN